MLGEKLKRGLIQPLWVSGVCWLLSACHPAQQAEHNQPVVPTVKSLGQQLADSLRKYRHLTEFRQANDSLHYVLYGTQTTFGKLGVVAITDSLLLLYQAETQGHLQLKASIPFPNAAFSFKEMDLNGDGQADFLVYGMPNMHGQSEPFVFLNKGCGRLQYRPDIKQYELAYNTSNHTVQATYFASGGNAFAKELYRWEGDSLRQIAGAECDADQSLVTVFYLEKGKRVGVKTYHNTAVYDTILFRAEW